MATITKRGERQWQPKIRRDGYPVQSTTLTNTNAETDSWTRLTENEMNHGVVVSRIDAEKNRLGEIIER